MQYCNIVTYYHLEAFLSPRFIQESDYTGHAVWFWFTQKNISTK